jgi:hypothetical protein
VKSQIDEKEEISTMLTKSKVDWLMIGTTVLITFGIMPEVVFADDITGPKLIAFDFDPKSIDTSTGSQTVTFTVRITDDLSGFKYGYWRLESPSGSEYWHATINTGVQNGTNRYRFISGDTEGLDVTYESDIDLPLQSESGTWYIRNAYFYDNVGNYLVLNEQTLIDKGFPTTVNVVSTPDDTTGPDLANFDFSPKSVDTSTGSQTVTFTVRITDDLSGFKYGYWSLKSPSGTQYWHATINTSVQNGTNRYRFISGDTEGLDVTYESDIDLPVYSESGTWYIQNAYFYDNVGNYLVLNEQALIDKGFPTTVQVGVNESPVADAGKDCRSPILFEINLNGSGSYDLDEDYPLAYAWTIVSQPAGNFATISDPHSASPRITPDLLGDYVCELVVTDSKGLSSEPDYVTIRGISIEVATSDTLVNTILVFEELPTEVLKNKNSSDSLINKTEATLKQIDEGLYQEALDKLQNDILLKTDGCAIAGYPDATDWITTCEGQDKVYPLVMRAIELLQKLQE